MTLIAALPCSDGVVVCADSQETAGDYKAETNKLSIATAGPYEVLFAGAGNKASLIDGLCDRILAELSHGGDPTATMQVTVRDYYRDQVRLCPGSDEEKFMEAVVCVRTPQGMLTFHVAESVVRFVTDRPVLIGHSAKLYRHFLDRQYRADMPLGQGVSLGVSVIGLAARTSAFVNAPIRAAVVKAQGIFQEPHEQVLAIQERLDRTSNAFDELVLKATDLSVTSENFGGVVDAFRAQLDDHLLRLALLTPDRKR